jgi:5-methyltetrahydrofolate--homocysteine methyltransferase
MPDRAALNAAFMGMATAMGMDAAITNPLEQIVHTAILAGDLFLGHDDYGGRWIKDFRKREKAKPTSG